MSSLPAGWRWATLGEIADVVGGVTKDSKRQSRPDLVEVPYLRVANVQRGRIDLSNVATIRVPPQKAAQLELLPGDVLLNEGGDRDKLGRGWVWQGQIPGCIHQNHVFRARIKRELLHPKLLAWYANEVARRWFEVNGKQSVNLASISLSKIRTFPVPVPPVPEQARIVDILEGHLSRIEAAEGVCANVTRRASALRLSVLSKALFDRDDWPRMPLREVLDLSIGGLWGAVPGVSDVDVHVLRVTELKRHGELEPSTAVVRSVSERQLAPRALAPGDLLLEKSGGGPNTPVGRVGLVAGLPGPAVCSNFMQLMRPRQSVVVPRFLHLYLNAFYLRGGTAPMQKSSTNIRNIKASDYMQIPVPLPDLITQEATVARLHAELSSLDRLVAEVQRGHLRSSALRRSLFDAAFSGRLTGRGSDLDLAEEMSGV